MSDGMSEAFKTRKPIIGMDGEVAIQCAGCNAIIHNESECCDYCSQPTKGVKYDEGKPRLELIPPEAIIGVGKVLGFGANKYGDRNWQKGIKVTRLVGSLLRHLMAFLAGVDNDKESGLPHIDHAVCNAMMIKWMLVNKPDQDDRVGSRAAERSEG